MPEKLPAIIPHYPSCPGFGMYGLHSPFLGDAHANVVYGFQPTLHDDVRIQQRANG